MKKQLSQLYAKITVKKLKLEQLKAVEHQERILKKLINTAAETDFGRDHSFADIDTYNHFVDKVPVRDYEAFSPYIEKIKKGEKNVLWKGKPIYLSKTSGTTSGIKYIPITKESISNHINSAKNALLCYISETGKADFVNGKMIFLQGSPKLDTVNGVKIGRLSGIVAHHVPFYLQANRMPTLEINSIEDWETKMAAIVDETIRKPMSLISGIPPWVQMYFEWLIAKSEKSTIAEIFPSFSLLIYGGVNYKPYQSKIEQLIGKKIDTIELYPASEGFIAFQDSQEKEGMMLNVNSGIFFEFVEASKIHEPIPPRIYLKDVELNVNYALIISNNAGLWSYNIGDTIKFVSLNPYRIVVTGRIKHFTSAFGEHVISEEVEAAVKYANDKLKINISEFHVAPVVNPSGNELPHHEWLVETDANDSNLAMLADELDSYLQSRNAYYKDLRTGNILQRLKLTLIVEKGFNEYMKSIGKLGGQNKLPRLSNDRKVADALYNFKK